MKIRVIHAVWGAGDEVYAGGEHEIAKPSKDLLKLIAGAEAAGTVEVFDATAQERAQLGKHVQSQEDGEAALSRAMGDWDDEKARWSGAWHDANVAQYELDVANGAREEQT